MSADRPVAMRPDWAQGRIQAEEARDEAYRAMGCLFVCLWFGGLAGFALLLYATAGVRDLAAYLILGLFAAAGLLPFASVAQSQRLHARYGRSVFEMAGVPASPGARLTGVVVVQAALPAHRPVRVTLTCWQRSEHRSFGPHVVWEAEDEVLPQRVDQGTRIPVEFAIAPEARSSEPGRLRGGIYWQLRLEGVGGFANSFEVPVFRGEPGPAPSAPAAPPALSQPSHSTIVVSRPAPGVTHFRFRFGKLALAFTLVLPIASPLALLMPLPTGWSVFGCVLSVAFGAAVQLTEPMGIDVSPEGVALRKGYRGWFARRRVPLSDLRRIRLHDCVNFLKQVQIQTRGYEELAASRVVGVMEARWLEQELRRAIAEAGGRLDEA